MMNVKPGDMAVKVGGTANRGLIVTVIRRDPDLEGMKGGVWWIVKPAWPAKRFSAHTLLPVGFDTVEGGIRDSHLRKIEGDPEKDYVDDTIPILTDQVINA